LQFQSNKLEEKKKLQESLRREAFREHRQYKTAEFLSRLEAELPDRSTRQIALRDPQSSTWVSGMPCRVAIWYFIKRHLVNED